MQSVLRDKCSCLNALFHPWSELQSYATSVAREDWLFSDAVADSSRTNVRDDKMDSAPMINSLQGCLTFSRLGIQVRMPFIA